jgi:protease-4
MMASLAPWRPDERAAIQASMEAVYGTFVARVAEGRHKTPDAIRAIAEGRVWTGARAKELGLVDAIGGLDAAIAEAKDLAHLAPSAGLEVYPPAPTLRDIFQSFGDVDAPLGLGTSAGGDVLAALRALHPTVAAATEHLVKLVLSFRSSTIQAVAILPVLP